MAIYHLHLSILSRRAGRLGVAPRSALAFAAYRHCERFYDERQGLWFDYIRRERRIIHRNILAPPDAPSWVFQPSSLWDTVERSERRHDARLARLFDCALPNELAPVQQIEIAEAWAQQALVAHGMVADLVVSKALRRGDRRNTHFHCMATTRQITSRGFGPKQRAWDRKVMLFEWRGALERITNAALAAAGIDERVSCRSLVDQQMLALESEDVTAAEALNHPPSRHRGPFPSG